MERFLPSLDAHFRKSVDYVVLDTRFMTADQKATVLRYIETSGSQQRDRLILIQ